MLEMKNIPVYIIAVIAATGGLLFGFDTGVISGAIPFFQEDFGIDNSAVELITSSGLVGCILGALFCGKVTDRLGRKKVILAAGLIFAAGALWSGLAADIYSLLAARLFLGVAIGVSSFAVPLYIAEISPAQSRGSLVSLFQLMITIGILASYFSDLLFADEQDVSCWRPMFYIGVVPAFILLAGMSFMPESPRWLASKGQEENRSRWKDLLQPWLRTPLIIAVLIMFFQQSIGINTVIYYSPKIFLMAGFDSTVSAIWASVGVGLVNVLFTVLSVFFIDRLGRRKLYFTGLTGITLSLLALSACFVFFNGMGEAGKWLAIVLVFCYVAFFAVSLGPLGWLIISEVFPQQLRGLGSSLGSLSVWVFNTVITFTFFKIVQALSIPGTELAEAGPNAGNPAGAFCFYAVIGIAGLVWGYFYIPETKGVPLEKIEAHWRKGGKPADIAIMK
jgi:MFS family permease